MQELPKRIKIDGETCLFKYSFNDNSYLIYISEKGKHYVLSKVKGIVLYQDKESDKLTGSDAGYEILILDTYQDALKVIELLKNQSQ